MLEKIRRKGLLGVLTKLSQFYWLMKSRFYYGPQFAAFGRRSVIRKPIFIANPGGITVGDGCFARDGVRLEVVDRVGEPRGELVIGNNVDIEQNVHIVACGRVVIEDDVCITANCAIIDTTHPFGYSGGGNRANFTKPGLTSVHIGQRVFIGVGSVIMPNVSIGDNSVIGAGSVVTHDIPPNCIAVGAPARVIGNVPVKPTSA